MPSAYTSQIAENISFRNFALSCARNFGAAIALRDEDSSVLPDSENVKFNSGENYHKEKLSQAIAQKQKLLSLSQFELQKRYENWRQQKILDAQNRIKEKKELRDKYEQMLKTVEGWTPPTSDHVNMKSFMIQQIKDSIDWDCNEQYDLERIEETENSHQASYFWGEIKDLDWSIEYHKKNSLMTLAETKTGLNGSKI